jgi:hypothetical protein
MSNIGAQWKNMSKVPILVLRVAIKEIRREAERYGSCY